MWILNMDAADVGRILIDLIQSGKLDDEGMSTLPIVESGVC